MALSRSLRIYGYHLKLVPRIRELLALEGYYVLSSHNSLWLEYQKSDSKLSFSRWLLKSKKILPDDVARVAKEVKEASNTVKFSCRYSDILRMSTTKHFNACTRPGGLGRFTPRNILKDDRSAIIYQRDRSGQFVGRCIVRLQESGEFKILRPYGTLNFDNVSAFLTSLKFKVENTTDDTVCFYEYLKRIPKCGSDCQ